MSKTSAVVLAGGFGTRLRSSLPDLPKPLAPAAGRPFVEWIVRYLANQGIRETALSTGYLAEKIESHFSNTDIPEVQVACVKECEPLGTAGGFLNAVVGSPFRPSSWLVCNGDSLAIASLGALFDALSIPGTDAAVLALWMDDASRYGSLEVDAEGFLSGFSEKRPGSAWINAGVYLFRASLLAEFGANRPLSFEKDVFPCLLQAERKIRVCQMRGDFLDIGLPESFAQADAFIHRNHTALSLP